MKYFFEGLPPNINKYIGRTNIWEYQKDKQNYHKKIDKAIKETPPYVAPQYSACNMTVIYHFPDRRIRDCTNLDKCLLDGLVEAKVIVDDNWTVIKKYTTIGVFDKGNPMVELIIEPIEADES